MLGIVVVACDKGVKPAGKAINRRVECRVIFIGEDDVELSIKLGGSEVAEVFGYEREADDVALRAVAEDILLNLSRQLHKCEGTLGKSLICHGGGHGCAGRKDAKAKADNSVGVEKCERGGEGRGVGSDQCFARGVIMVGPPGRWWIPSALQQIERWAGVCSRRASCDTESWESGVAWNTSLEVWRQRPAKPRQARVRESPEGPFTSSDGAGVHSAGR